MVPRPKRRCVAKSEEQRVKSFAGAPDEAATDDDRAKWTGWSDLESEPAIFNSILARWGINGVKTCEVTSMDADTLRDLPQPIYGIIFLYRYSDVDAEPEEEESDPGHPWFATQNMNNMCGSLALLNMVMNIDELELGAVLERFKKDTMSKTPVERGDAVADFAALRRIHNSWAKKVDMLNQDLKLQQDFLRAKRRKSGGSKRKAKPEVQDEMAYHFVAYVPIGDRVWKMDGMEQNPQQLEQRGRGDSDWLDQVSSLLSQRMAEFIGNEISFNVLAMTKDPLVITHEQLAQNIKMMQAVDLLSQERVLHKAPAVDHIGSHMATNGVVKVSVDAEQTTGTKDKVEMGAGVVDTIPNTENSVPLLGPAPAFEITEELLNGTEIPETMSTRIATSKDLLGLSISLMSEQDTLREAYRESQRSQRAESQRAEARRREYGPLVAKWARFLAHVDDAETGKSMLETLIAKS